SSLTPMVDDTAPLYYVRKLPMPFVLLSGDRELELYGRYEEQAYFWRMMQLHQNDQCLLYEMDGYDHGNMPEAGHKIMVRHIKTICDGKKIKR
ncbi:MAG: alpha/beta hydrolase, partial [Bacteroidaceae bacterium]|nr:alpha/beta hydrolase [Bacteroidaceae bacterium]